MALINEKPGRVSFTTAWKDFFKGYVDFKGRSTRAGYWWVHLILLVLEFVAIIAFIVPFVVTILNHAGEISSEEITSLVFKSLTPLIVAGLLGLILFLPSLALTVRRIRDVGLRGRGQLVLFVLYFVILYFSQRRLIATGAPEDASPVGLIFNLAMFILSLLPSGSFATTQESGLLAFFFKNKSYYESDEY